MEEDETYTSDLLTGSVTGGQGVLGVSWNPTNDVLEFDIKQIAISLHTLSPAKHNIVSSLQDFTTHWAFCFQWVIVMPKIFFQKLCKFKFWDDHLYTKWVAN